MLVNLREILQIAKARTCAVGSFNTPNLESILAVIGAAEDLDVPVIIMHAEIHESISPISVIGPIMVACARRAKVPVCVHLDHGEHLAYLQRALDMGFTSVMYDGSALSFAENTANTCIAVGMARQRGASVEGEIGVLGKRELGYGESEMTASQPQEVYTEPEDARQFAETTGIDALACSFGTAHGIYIKKPILDLGVLERVRAKVSIPLVMHGGSGVSPADYRRVIEKGVRKINYYTYMAKAGGEMIEHKLAVNRVPFSYQGENYKMYFTVTREAAEKPIYYHEIVQWGTEAMKKNVLEALKIFSAMES